jgi:hypothetical protein
MTIKEIIDQTNDEVNNKRKEQRESIARNKEIVRAEYMNRFTTSVPEGVKQSILKGKDYIEIYDDRNNPGLVIEVMATLFPEMYLLHRTDNSNLVYKWCY